ncbi:MAG TPA: 3-methyl-2-oxobutanoate dehydrogenase subunit VorB [Candidatus Brocadiia bacterium]|nr:3-methyl-2-oxobutanoate dehydrogenase subunit VorB [Candidatus Brocadiia bacterium]
MNTDWLPPEKCLLTGNEASVEGALLGGCRFFVAYPITPQNEVIGRMSWRMEEVGGVFIQAESEVASINIMLGASCAGVRVMTSSSSPGISLMQEGISYMASMGMPCVISNVQRGGPGLGDIGPSQGDYFQATRGGGHGDYHCIVLSPYSGQEVMELTKIAFDLADQWRTPTIILGDAQIGQMMEPVIFKGVQPVDVENMPPKPWALTGAKGRPFKFHRSYLGGKGELEGHNEKLQAKYRDLLRSFPGWQEVTGPEDADILLVAYGSTARVCKGLVEEPPEGLEGKLRLFRPKSVWPYPYAALKEEAMKAKCVLTVEMCSGQMVQDVRLALEGARPVFFAGRVGQGVPTSDQIARKALDILAGRALPAGVISFRGDE